MGRFVDSPRTYRIEEALNSVGHRIFIGDANHINTAIMLWRIERLGLFFIFKHSDKYD